MPNHKQLEDDNAGIHINKVVSAVPCGQHAADIGQACWNIISSRGPLKAICDRRARSAGCNSDIMIDTKNEKSTARAKYHQKMKETKK